jgi:hypothetical protein
MYQIIDEKIIGRKVDTNSDFLQLKVVHIVCDTAASVPEPLPEWAAGSRCDVLADSGTVYILSISGEWKQVNFYNRGGSGGDFDPENYYTKPQTDARITEKVAEIVADAPEDFDTLKEISDWISHHEDSAAAMNTAIQQNTTAIAGKVDKVSGKGLSTNDYTTTEKNKLSSVEEGATKTIVDTNLSSTSTNPVQNKAVQALIARLVDTGAKNGFDIETAYTSSASNNTTNALSNSNLSVASNGTYARLSLPYLYKSGTAMFSCTVSEIAISGGTVQIRFAKNSDSSNSIANPINITGNDEYTRKIVVEEDTPGYIIFYLNTTNTSYQNSAIFSKIMVCTAEDYAISQKFVPYTPTMREIYEKLISIASQ